MTSEKPSASVFKVKKLTGEWWIPGSDHHCYGTLTFDIFGEQHLKIIGFLEGQYLGNFQAYTVLHGCCKMDKKNILCDAFSCKVYIFVWTSNEQRGYL